MQRADKLLVEKGFASSRDEAKRMIMAGAVIIDGKTVPKPNTAVSGDPMIEVKKADRYVSRGGYKLEKALLEFNIDVKDKVCMDVGSSTGGFTDCLLRSGAKKVYAVDVGKGLMDMKLRNDPRVIMVERMNARYLSEKDVKERFGIITIDVSFISVAKIVPALLPFLAENGLIIALIKPQFESEKRLVMKGGIVKDPEVHEKVLEKLRDILGQGGLNIQNATFSPIKGQKGNIEYFFALSGQKQLDFKPDFGNIVKRAFNEAVKLH